MASRKILRPVSSPVDPFVAPANPGPKQSDHSWQGLLSLSDSLLKADTAYREADEKRTREGRVQAAEKRRVANQAKQDAPVASKVLDRPENKAIIARIDSGEATEEEQRSLSAALLEAGVTSGFNPVTLSAIKIYNVRELVTTGQYENTMAEPEWLASTDDMDSEQFRVAEEERTAQWVSEQEIDGKPVSQAHLPILMAGLRDVRERVDKIYTSRRTARHEAQKTDLIVKGTGRLVEAFNAPDDPDSAAFVKHFRSIYKELLVQDRIKTQATVKGSLQANFTNKIVAGEMSEADAHEILDAAQEFLTEEQDDQLGTVIATALARRSSADRDQGNKRTKVELAIRDDILHSLHIKRKELDRDLTLAEKTDLIKAKYETVGGTLAEAGLNPNAAARLIEDALDAAEARHTKKIVADPALLVSLTKAVMGLDPSAQDNVNTAYVNGDIPQDVFERLNTLADGLAAKNNGTSYVNTMADLVHMPAGISLQGEVMRAGIEAFEANRGEDRDVLRKKVSDAMESAVAAARKDLKTASAAYLIGSRTQGHVSGLANTIKKFVDSSPKTKVYYDGDEANRDSLLDVLNFIFEGMGPSQKAKYEDLTTEKQERRLGALVQNVLESPQDFIAHMGKQMTAARDAALSKALGGEAKGEAIAGVAHGRNWKTKSDLGGHWQDLQKRSGHQIRITEQRVLDNVKLFSNREKPMHTLAGRLPSGLHLEALTQQRSALEDRKIHTVLENRLMLPLVRSLAKIHGIKNKGGTALEMLDFSNLAQANDYVQAHFLQYGMPLEAFVKGKHLGVDIKTEEFAFDSAPLFSSPQALKAAIRFDTTEEKFIVSDTLRSAFARFGLSQNEENFSRFLTAQEKLTASTVGEVHFMKLMHQPDLAPLQSAKDKKVGDMTFINGSNDWFSGGSKPNVFRMKSLTDKMGSK